MVKAIRPNAPGRGQDMQWTGVRAGHTEAPTWLLRHLACEDGGRGLKSWARAKSSGLSSRARERGLSGTRRSHARAFWP